MISTLITIFSILVIILLFFKFELGVASYMLYTFLVPTNVLYFSGLTVGWNAILFLIIILYFFYYKGFEQSSWWQILPFIFLFFVQAFFIPFHFSQEPMDYQLNMFRVDIMSLFLPFVIVNISNTQETVSILKRSLYLAILINVLYGISLLFIPGQNPYITEIRSIFNYDDGISLDNAFEEGIRVFGYISACFKQVTQIGIFLLLSFVFVLYDFLLCTNKKIKWLLFALLIGIGILILFCGARSAFMAGVATISLYCLIRRKIKIFIYVAGSFTLILIILLNFFPEYATFINSIGTEDANGSSIAMRLEQIQGCIDSIENNPIFGNGYEWCHWYRTEIGRHPVMLSFESIAIMILCNNGILGLLIWAFFAFLIIKNFRRASIDNDVEFCLGVCLLATYFFYSLFTGDYGCRGQFMVFYAIYLATALHKQNSDVDYYFYE